MYKGLVLWVEQVGYDDALAAKTLRANMNLSEDQDGRVVGDCERRGSERNAVKP